MERPRSLALLLLALAAAPAPAQLFGQGDASPLPAAPLGAPQEPLGQDLRGWLRGYQEGEDLELNAEREVYAESLEALLLMSREGGRLGPREVRDPEGVRQLLRLYVSLVDDRAEPGFETGVRAAGFLAGLRKINGHGTPKNKDYDGFAEILPNRRYFYAPTFVNNVRTPLGRLVAAMHHDKPTFYLRRLRPQLEEWQGTRRLALSDALILYMFEEYPEVFHVGFAERHGLFGGDAAGWLRRALDGKGPAPPS